MKNKELISLVKRLKNKEANSFEDLYNKLWKTVYYIAFRYLGDSEAAKDITQDTFMMIYNKIDDLKDLEAFNRWMNQIVMNKCYHAQKKDNKLIYFDQMPYEPIEDNIEFLPAELLKNQEYQKLILDTVSKLPEKLKVIVLMYYFEQMNIEEIALTLEISVDSAYKRLQRARYALRSQFEEITYEVKSANVPAILSVILMNNHDSICTLEIKKQIYHNIQNNLVTSSSLSSSTISTVSKVLITLTIVSSVVTGGYFMLQTNNEDISNNKSPNVEVVELHLADFVGEENAEKIEHWSKAGLIDKDTIIKKIIDQYAMEVLVFYVDSDNNTTYALYQMNKQDKKLLICEVYNYEEKLWQVRYEIVDSNTPTIKESEIKQWFEQHQ